MQCKPVASSVNRLTVRFRNGLAVGAELEELNRTNSTNKPGPRSLKNAMTGKEAKTIVDMQTFERQEEICSFRYGKCFQRAPIKTKLKVEIMAKDTGSRE